MVIMYVRHGDAEDDKLTELGIKQCKLMVEQNESIKFTKIYSSPMNRCIETSKYLAEKYNLEIEVLSKLDERKTLGRDPKTDFEKEWFENYLNPHFSSENPEGCKNFLSRTAEALDEIIKTHKERNENVIVSAHSCSLYAIMAYFNNVKQGDINWYRAGNCSKVYFEIN